jgi:hypothetical protein
MTTASTDSVVHRPRVRRGYTSEVFNVESRTVPVRDEAGAISYQVRADQPARLAALLDDHTRTCRN